MTVATSKQMETTMKRLAGIVAGPPWSAAVYVRRLHTLTRVGGCCQLSQP